jgi:hypothetical protein
MQGADVKSDMFFLVTRFVPTHLLKYFLHFDFFYGAAPANPLFFLQNQCNPELLLNTDLFFGNHFLVFVPYFY